MPSRVQPATGIADEPSTNSDLTWTLSQGQPRATSAALVSPVPRILTIADMRPPNSTSWPYRPPSEGHRRRRPPDTRRTPAPAPLPPNGQPREQGPAAMPLSERGTQRPAGARARGETVPATRAERRADARPGMVARQRARRQSRARVAALAAADECVSRRSRGPGTCHGWRTTRRASTPPVPATAPGPRGRRSRSAADGGSTMTPCPTTPTTRLAPPDQHARG